MNLIDQLIRLTRYLPEAEAESPQVNILQQAADRMIAAGQSIIDHLELKAQIRFDTLIESGLLDQPPDKVFDALTELGANALRAPCCVIDLIDKSRMYMVSTYGFAELKDPPEYVATQSWPLEASFCKNVVDRETTLVVINAPEDPIVKDNLAAKNGSAIAYIGSPIYTVEGVAIGVMCVSDIVPRDWSSSDVHMLEKFTQFATQLLQLKVNVNQMFPQA